MYLLVVILGVLAASTQAAPIGNDTDGGQTNGCRRLTAAIGTGWDHYLFFGDTYVKLDYNLKQNLTGNSADFLGVEHPDAAFIWSIDYYTYVFEGKQYYSAWTDFKPVPAYVFGGRDQPQFFKDGLDAAGSVYGTTIFIKGCKYIVSLPTAPSDPMYLPDGTPCDVDAALTVGNYLWLFKNDKVWVMDTEGVLPHMPVDADTLVELDGIRFCKEGETEGEHAD